MHSLLSFESLGLTDVLVVTGLLLPVWIVYSRRSALKTTPLNGPPSQNVFLGLTKEILTAQDNAALHLKWADEYGPAFAVPMDMGKKGIMLCDVKACAHFFSKDTFGYQQLALERAMLKRFIGKGLLWAQGQDHKRQRHALNPAFSNISIRKLTGMFYECAYKIKNNWDLKFSQTGSNDIVVDVEEWMNKMALDSLGLAAFSYNFDTLDEANADIYQAFEAFADSKFDPWAIFVTILSYFFPPAYHLPHKGKAERELFDTVNQKIADDLIERDRAYSTESNIDTEDKSVLGLLLKSERALSQSTRTSPAEVLAQIKTFAVAGYLTTSVSLTWTLIQLCRSPDVQTKLREELMTFSPTNDPSWDDFCSNLPYLDSVVLEILRLNPPLPEIMRVATQDDVIPLSKPVTTATGETISSIVIRKGTVVLGAIAYLNRAPELWGPDAAEFKPERWLDMDNCSIKAKEIKGHKHLMSFSDGARICLGKNFSLAEMKSTLAVLLKSYIFEFAETKDPGFEKHFALMPRPTVKGATRVEVPLKIRRVEESLN